MWKLYQINTPIMALGATLSAIRLTVDDADTGQRAGG
jgi:hypothetical protein